MLFRSVVTGGWDDLGDQLVKRYRGVADRVVSYFAGLAWNEDPKSLERWARVTAAVKALARD